MTSRMCGAAYTRPNDETVKCTFVAGHVTADETRLHSWAALRLIDEAQARREPGSADHEWSLLIENIAKGEADEWLEAILAAAHGRKRARRGVRLPYGKEDC